MLLRNSLKNMNNKAQTAVEYMLLLAAVVSVVLIGFKQFLPKTTDSNERFFNKATTAIMGDPPVMHECVETLSREECLRN